jgi:cytochrome c2
MRIALFVASMMMVSCGANAADLAAGEKVFAKCHVCHDIGAGAKNKIGPVLNGVVGRPWGSIEGFKYSTGREGTLLAINEAEPHSWTPEMLRAYLHNPKDIIPKGKMSFAGLKDDVDVENLVYFLAQFDATGTKVDPDAVLAAFPATN